QAYQPTAKFTTWLYRIATNVAFNYKRDHWYQSLCYSLDQQPQDRLKLQVPDHRLSIEEMKLRESSVNEIRSAIAALPDRQRACVLLHKYEEMEYSDIASALDCSVPAVKSLLFRAYETLRARLAHFSTTRPSTTNALQNEYRPNCARILARSAAA